MSKIKKNSVSFDALYYYSRGLDKFNKKDYKGAIDDYTEAIKQNPNYIDAYLNRGICYTFCREYKKSVKDCSKIINLNPNRIDAYINRGVSYNYLKEYKKAIDDFEKALEAEKNNASIYNNLGYSYYKTKNYTEAIINFEKAIALNPLYDLPYYNKGLCEFAQRNYKEAIKNYEEAIKNNQEYTLAFYEKGKSELKLGNKKEAMKSFKKVIELSPRNYNAYNSIGNLYYNDKKYDMAIEHYNKGISINPNIGYLYYNKSLAAKKLGDNKEAKYNLEQAIKYDSKYKEKKNVANVKLKEYEYVFYEGKRDHSIDNYAEAVKKYNEAIEIYENILKTKKDYKDKDFLDNVLKEKKFAENKMSERYGYLAFADILGWRGIWQRQRNKESADNACDFIDKLLEIKEKVASVKIEEKKIKLEVRLISDTFVIFSSDLNSQIIACNTLIKECLEAGLLIRGAISYGAYYTKDNVYIGPAVDEAASWHEKAEEITIFLTPSANLKLLRDNKKHPLLEEDDIYTKIGNIRSHYIKWYERKLEERFNNIIKNEIIFPEISQKYFNTLKKIANEKEKIKNKKEPTK